MLTFFKINFFKKLFQEHYQSIEQFGSRSGRTFCQTVYKGYQQTTKVDASKERVKDIMLVLVEDETVLQPWRHVKRQGIYLMM